MTYPALYTTESNRPRTLTPDKAAHFADGYGDEAAAVMLRTIGNCKLTKMAEMTRLSDLADRYDNLYYPNQITEGGADHWPEDPNRQRPGGTHISLNSYPVYIDIPAALLSVEPVENILPADAENDDNRKLAATVERMYFAWKEKTDFELKAHKAAITKALYGRTAAKVWWDDDAKHVQWSVVDQPRNLWLGYSDSDYTKLNWAIYVTRLSAMAILEEYGLDVVERRDEAGEPYVVVVPPTNFRPTQTYSRPNRQWLVNQDFGMVEVHDYWYRKPKDIASIAFGQKTVMETWNAIVVGNVLIKDEVHPEYDGALPYVPVFNTYIPGVPDGRSAFYDIEQLIREKDERLSASGAMIGKAVSGQFWQLVGPDAPDRVPTNLRPRPNEVISPGAGNRIESIDPWMPEFQVEQHLTRLDRELEDVSGLTALLRGLAPAAILSSAKAINTLVSHYEVRITMQRSMYYAWRKGVWDLTKIIWQSKDSKLKPIFAAAGRLLITNPSLNPRDDLEQATRSLNLLSGKIWSQVRAMDATGVEDPEAEQMLIREERTDASLFPGDVIQQMSVLQASQQLGIGQQQLQQQQQGISPDQASAAQAAAQGGQQGAVALNQPGTQPMTPPEAMPQNAATGSDQALQQLLQSGALPGGGGGTQATAQSLVTDQGIKSRIKLTTPLGGPPQQGP